MDNNMNENINLCKLLKGHENEVFYSPIMGEIKLKEVDTDSIGFTSLDNGIVTWVFTKNGKLNICDTSKAECLLFPSKDQRDWDKWDKEQKAKKIPKNWYQLVNSRKDVHYTADTYSLNNKGKKPIEKSALALLKIHQIIEIGYGGVPTKEERNNLVYIPDYVNYKWQPAETYYTINQITFHTKEQCKEFLSYPENIQLLKDFYMI